MKALFYRYGSICEPDLIEAFKEYGIEVREIGIEIHNKNFVAADMVKLIGKVLQEEYYSFVFTVNFFPALSDVCNLFQMPYLCLIVDSPVMELYSESLRNPVNRIFLFDRILYQEFQEYNPGHIFHIPLATNVKRWGKVIQADHTKRFAADVSFVGSLYTEKDPYVLLKGEPDWLRGYLNGIMEAQLRVYGYYFIEDLLTDEIVEEFLKYIPEHYVFPENARANDKASVAQLYIGNHISAMERVAVFKRLSELFSVDIYTGSDTSAMPGIHNRGLAKTLTEMPLIYNRSKINLNITSKAIRSGLPLRIFDIMGCGGFVLTNYQAELPEIFNLGEHLVAYSSLAELEILTDYYLQHPKEREEIARAGYEEVANKHTYEIRVGQMISLAFGDLISG